jgi:hypothetical protein
VTFNHGVEGSSPSALTKVPLYLQRFLSFCLLGWYPKFPFGYHMGTNKFGDISANWRALSSGAHYSPRLLIVSRAGRLQRERRR